MPVVADFSDPRRDYLRLLPWVDYAVLPEAFVRQWSPGDPEPEWQGAESSVEPTVPRMSANDAHALAAALTRALPEVPDHDALGDKVLADMTGDERFRLWGCPLRPGAMVTALEEFSGPNKAILRSLITFLQGPGTVWMVEL